MHATIRQRRGRRTTFVVACISTLTLGSLSSCARNDAADPTRVLGVALERDDMSAEAWSALDALADTFERRRELRAVFGDRPDLPRLLEWATTVNDSDSYALAEHRAGFYEAEARLGIVRDGELLPAAQFLLAERHFRVTDFHRNALVALALVYRERDDLQQRFGPRKVDLAALAAWAALADPADRDAKRLKPHHRQFLDIAAELSS